MDAGDVRAVELMIGEQVRTLREWTLQEMSAQIAVLAAGLAELSALVATLVPATPGTEDEAIAAVEDAGAEESGEAIAEAAAEAEGDAEPTEPGSAEEVAEQIEEAAAMVAAEAEADAAPERLHFLERPLFGRGRG